MANVSWILVADRTRARLLHVLPHEQEPFPTVACFTHAAGRLRPRERDSDEPSRVVHPAGHASALEPHEDREHVEAVRFAAELVDYLERSRQDGRFDRLIIIAPPKFLGVLRNAWTPSLQRMVEREETHDLLGLSDVELQVRLEDLVAARVG
jgi:protein required for attachment to host cells